MKMRISSTEQIDPSEIIFLKAEINYTSIILTHKKILSSRTLKIMMERLNSALFVKISRGVVVNKNFVKAYNNDKLDAYVTLANNETFAISRKRFAEVCLALKVN